MSAPYARVTKGFTLIELLLVVGLLALTVGITSDILLSIVRTYNKTQVTNEIEQQANFVSLKLEKEIRNAQTVTLEGGGVGDGDAVAKGLTFGVAGLVLSGGAAAVFGGLAGYTSDWLMPVRPGWYHKDIIRLWEWKTSRYTWNNGNYIWDQRDRYWEIERVYRVQEETTKYKNIGFKVTHNE